MAFQPDPLQTLFIWSLLFHHHGEAWLKEVKPELKSPSTKRRRVLEDNGLIVLEKRRSSKKGLSNYVILTEQGWHWANEHLDAPISKRSNAAAPILESLLCHLQAYLQHNEHSLATLMSPIETEDLSAQIRAAYLKLSAGRLNVRVRLADLRAALNQVTSEALEQCLLKLQATSDVVLYPFDDPTELQERDRTAAILVANEPTHLIYWRK